EQPRHFKVEDDEQNRDEVESDVELHARVVECLKAGLEGRHLLRVRTLNGNQERSDKEGQPNNGGKSDEDDDRQVIAEQVSHAAACSIGRSRRTGRAETAGNYGRAARRMVMARL